MMRKLRLADERAAEEAALIDAAPEAKPLLNRLEEIYEELRQEAPRSAALDGLRGIYHGSALLAVSHAVRSCHLSALTLLSLPTLFSLYQVHEGGVEAKKADGEREAGYRSRNLPFLVKRLGKRLKDMHPPLEAALITRAARRAISCEGLADGKTLLEVAPSLRQIEAAADALAAGSMPPTADLDEASIEAALSGGATDDQGSRPPVTEDVFSRVASELYPAYVASRDKQTALLSERDQLLASLLELQRKHSSEAFYPDANGCLRLSAGHVEGYKAADAVSHSPVTTIAGLVDKHEEASLTRRDDDDGADEFACPSRLLAACASDDAVGRTPVNTLYSTDTVGGNSGSPVLDADGKFVAINFDRQRLGLMNE